MICWLCHGNICMKGSIRFSFFFSTDFSPYPVMSHSPSPESGSLTLFKKAQLPIVWYSVLILSVERKKKIIFMDFGCIILEENLWHFLHFKNSFPILEGLCILQNLWKIIVYKIFSLPFNTTIEYIKHIFILYHMH